MIKFLFICLYFFSKFSRILKYICVLRNNLLRCALDKGFIPRTCQLKFWNGNIFLVKCARPHAQIAQFPTSSSSSSMSTCQPHTKNFSNYTRVRAGGKTPQAKISVASPKDRTHRKKNVSAHLIFWARHRRRRKNIPNQFRRDSNTNE